MRLLNVSREDFPRSTAFARGMQCIHPVCDNQEMRQIRDIIYTVRSGIPLTVQLILPDLTGAPLIVYVTGSAFHRQDIPCTLPRLALLANRGFAVASVQYRGSEDAPFPAQILDVKAALRFLRANAAEYGYDADNIFLMGDSSGGHTALMAGLTAGLSALEETDEAVTVRGIISYYAPTDIAKMQDEPSIQDHDAPDSPEGYLIGRRRVSEHPELSAPTVVMQYVTAECEIPPVLLFHGTHDETVPFAQSCMLFDRLRDCGKDAAFYAVEGAHHGGQAFWSGEVLTSVARFIQQYSEKKEEQI